MAKTIILNLSPQIIADFESSFDTKQAEKAYLYKHTTQNINKVSGDTFIKRNITIRLLENGKQIIQQSTLDEVNFEQTEIPSDPNWKSKDIGGKLEPYEYLVGDSFWKKINNWVKLLYILNSKYNASVIDDGQKSLSKLVSDKKTPETQIKLKEEQLEKNKAQLIKSQADECIEVYLYNLFVEIIIAKIQSSEQEILDKEFADLNKPKDKPKR